MATSEKSKKVLRLTLEIDDRIEAENLRRALIMAKQNIDSAYLQELIDGTNEIISRLMAGD